MHAQKRSKVRAEVKRKGKLTIAERLEQGTLDYELWSKKFETNPRLKAIYEEESAKMEMWLRL